MKLTEGQIKMMQEDMYAELIQILMADYDYSLDEAMETLYNSETFARLQDANTGLYYQSPGYVYSFLNSELSLCDYRSFSLPYQLSAALKQNKESCLRKEQKRMLLYALHSRDRSVCAQILQVQLLLFCLYCDTPHLLPS